MEWVDMVKAGIIDPAKVRLDADTTEFVGVQRVAITA